MNKMDDFFKKRLDDQTPSEDAWNIPSDDLWNNAKVHFPKEKKKKRWFWIPMLLGLFLCTSIGFYLGRNSLINKNTTTIITDSNKQITPIFDNKENNPSINKIDNQKENVAQNTDTENNEVAQQPNIAAKKNIQKLKKKIIVATPSSIEKATQTNNNSLDANLKSFATTPTIIKESSISSVISEQSIEIDNNIDTKVNSIDSKNEIAKENSDIIESKLFSTENIMTPLLLSFKQPIKKITTKDLSKKIIPKAKRIHNPNQEFGIGYSETLLRIPDLIDYNNLETGEKFILDMKYKNANLHYTKWLTKKWSVSTGLYFSEFDLNLDASEFSVIDDENINNFISKTINIDRQLRQSVNPTKITSDDFKFQLVDGTELIKGDSINIQTEVDLYARGFQIPALLNYHIYKNKFEWIFSVGGSLDIVYIDLKASDITIYKEGVLINEPTQIPEILGTELFGSIHGVASLRYHINRKLNFGLSSKIYFDNFPLSNLEAGLYYRF